MAITNLTIKSSVARIMLAPLLSKLGLNSIFLVFLAFVIGSLMTGEVTNQESFFLAAFPAIVISSALWFNFTNQIHS
jgi:hypothetical protein